MKSKYTEVEAVNLVRACYQSGEPLFIIKGSDHVAQTTIKDYAKNQKNAAGPDNPETPEYKHAEEAEKFAAYVLNWQLENLDKVKLAN